MEKVSIPDKTGFLQNPIFHILLITILGLLAYSNTFNVPFVFDDTPNIVDNYKLRDLSNFWPPVGSRWFGFLTFALNYKLGGLNVIGYHIFNLTIHILNAILIYFLVALTFRTPYFSSQYTVASKQGKTDSPIQPFTYLPLFTALLFVSHPIQTQAVTYLSQRFASLATMFYLFSLAMYIKARLTISQQSAPHPSLPLEGGGLGRRWRLHAKRYTLFAISLISSILAMKTKEVSATLPVIIGLYEFSFFSSAGSELRSHNSKLQAPKLKRFLFLLPFLFTLILIPLDFFGPDLGVYTPKMDPAETIRHLQLEEASALSRYEYFLTQLSVIVTYIRLLVLPIKQNLDYDYPIYNSFLNPNVFLSFLFLMLIFGFGVYLLYRSLKKARISLLIAHNTPPQSPLSKGGSKGGWCYEPSIMSYERFIAFGIFWFFITLSVESSIIPIKDVIFEHRVYLPSVGIMIAFSIAVFYILRFMVYRLTPSVSRFLLPAAYSLLTIIIIVFSIATYQRNIIWKDEVSLWEDVVKKSPQNARAHNNLGLTYANKGWTDKAIEHYQIALRLNPSHLMAHNNLGNTYQKKGWIDRAIQEYETVLVLEPEDEIAYNNLGTAYADKGWTDKAMEHYQIALKLNPWYADAHYNLGNTYSKKGWIDAAIEHYQIALKMKPDFAKAHSNLGFAYYYYKGWVDKAIEHYQIALRLDPYNAKTHINIGIAYKAEGQTDKAMEHFSIARGLKSNQQK